MNLIVFVKFIYHKKIIWSKYGSLQFFFFVGGFDNDQRIGLIKLFKFKEEKNIDIIFLQDIEIETNKNEFYRFNNAVNNIIQSKNTGEFVMTTVDGSFCHLSRANLDIHINSERKKMKMKN